MVFLFLLSLLECLVSTQPLWLICVLLLLLLKLTMQLAVVLMLMMVSIMLEVCLLSC